MRSRVRQHLEGGFTLTEMLVVVALVAIVLMLAAPSFRDMIELQRLRSASAQFVTDVQFTRTEAISRQEVMGIAFGSTSTITCYIVYSCGTTPASQCGCSCTAATNRCASPRREIRTVQLDRSAKVTVASVRVTTGTATSIANRVLFDPATGGVTTYFPIPISGSAPPPASELWAETALIRASAAPTLRTEIGALGRPHVCAPGGRVAGVETC